MKIGEATGGRRYGFLRALPDEGTEEVIDLRTGKTLRIPAGSVEWEEVYPSVMPTPKGESDDG